MEEKIRPALLIEGIVRDAESGGKVADALLYSATDVDPGFGFDSDITTIPHTVTDIRGRFSLRVESPGTHTVVARHADYRETATRNMEPGGEAVIPIGRGFTISGTALDPRGLPAEGGTIKVTGSRSAGIGPLEHRVPVGPLGAFVTAKLHPGDHVVTLEDAPGYEGGSFFLGSEKVMVRGWDIAEVAVGARPGHGLINGVLLSNGSPVPLADVLIRSTWRPLFDQPDPLNLWKFGKKATTDDYGRFVIFALMPGGYDLKFRPAGRQVRNPAYSIREDYSTFVNSGDSGPQSFMIPHGSIRGRLVDLDTGDPITREGSFCVIPFGSDFMRRVPVNRDGTFEACYIDTESRARLIATAPGYAATGWMGKSRQVSREVGDVPLKRTKIFKARVKCWEPLELGNLTFEYRRLDLEIPATEMARDEKGRFIFDRAPKWAYIVCTYKGIEIMQRIVPEDDADQEPVEVVFSFLDAPRLCGRVVTKTGRVVENATVCLSREEREERYLRDLEVFGFTRFRELPSARTDACGFFEIVVPEPGRYHAWLFDECGFAVPLEKDSWAVRLDLEPGRNDFDLKIGGFSLSGRLVDAASDAPVAPAAIFLHQGKSRLAIRTVADRAGRFLFPFLTRSRGELEITAQGFPIQRRDKVVPHRKTGKKDLCIRLGEEGGAIRLLLDGEILIPDADLSHALVTIGETSFQLRQLVREREDEQVYLCRGIPLDRASRPTKVKVSYGRNKKTYSGEASVELKEEEIVDVPVFLR